MHHADSGGFAANNSAFFPDVHSTHIRHPESTSTEEHNHEANTHASNDYSCHSSRRLSAAGPAAAQSAQEKQNFGSHVSHCAHVMGGFSGDHNPSMMNPLFGTEHTCPMPG